MDRRSAVRWTGLVALALTLTVLPSRPPSESAAIGPGGSWITRVSAWIRASEYHFSPAPAGGWSAPNRAHGLRSIPVRFGVGRSLVISRVMHVITIVCLAVLGPLAQLGWIYGAGVAGVALLLVYEQSLVSEHDLSQVKRAFDLNGYVGILYLVVLAVSLYVR